MTTIEGIAAAAIARAERDRDRWKRLALGERERCALQADWLADAMRDERADGPHAECIRAWITVARMIRHMPEPGENP